MTSPETTRARIERNERLLQQLEAIKITNEPLPSPLEHIVETLELRQEPPRLGELIEIRSYLMRQIQAMQRLIDIIEPLIQEQSEPSSE